MNEIRIERKIDTVQMGTFGMLYMPRFSCWTLERPFVGNKPFLSAIPEGTYELAETVWDPTDKALRTFEVMDVPDRTHIKFHPANRADELQGCIALGMRLGCIEGDWAITRSRDAHVAWMAEMVRSEIRTLRIIGA